MIAFLDASALIYLIEGTEPFAASVREQLKTLTASNESLRLSMSTLSRLECRIRPLKTGDTQTLAEYDAFFSQPDLILVSLSIAVIDLATTIRARHGLKTPDALQAACCLQLGADHVFLTGDSGFRRVEKLRTEMLG